MYDDRDGYATHIEAKSAFDDVGFTFGDMIDDLLLHAELPIGWTCKRTDQYWSDILDDQGRIRGDIFYKAAFYDRDAFATLVDISG